MDTRIVPAGHDRVPELATLLGRAFADDPMISFPFPAGDPYEQARRMFEIVDLRFAEARLVWEVPPARGVAMWVDPDDFDRYLRIENEIRDEVESLTDDGGARYRAFWEWIEAALPDERQWFLDLVDVDERERGRGIGSALVRFGLDRAARDGVIATLETARPENVPICEHLGFRTYLETDAPGGGPHMWFMRADPA